MSDGPDYEMLFPLICCKTNGGTLDDHAFVAGIRYAEIEQAVSTVGEWQGYTYPELLAQIDLMAMHHGCTVTAEPWDEFPDEWTLVTITSAAEGQAVKLP